MHGKCRFSGSCSSETLGPIFTKVGTFDYIHDLTNHANPEINPTKGGGGAWLRMREVVAVSRRQASIFTARCTSA